MPESTLDLTMLESLVEVGGDDFVRSLIDDFLAEAGELIASMHTALAAQDATTFHRAAHTLKSSAAYLGAAVLSAQARDLETLSRSGDLTAADPAEKLTQLDDEFQLARAALLEWQKSAR